MTFLRTSGMPWDEGNVVQAHFIHGTEGKDFSFVPSAERDSQYNTPVMSTRQN